MGFKGSMYTWWNGKADGQCIFKRLDRCLANQRLQSLYPNFEVEHLIKQGSDHSPLLITCKADSRVIRKSFRFLNFWIDHPSFLDVVKNNWNGIHGSDPFYIFHSRLKKLSKVLSKWSRDTYGNIFKQIDTLEEIVKIHEQEFEKNPSGANRERLQKVQAELINFYAVEEKFWKQNQECSVWLDREEDIVEEAITFFQSQFTAETEATDFELLKHIPKLISEEQNKEINEFPEENEIKNAIFGLNVNSAGGPDGYTGKFFQATWEIIAKDIITMVHSFFCGHELPRYITCTNLVLLPKNKDVVTCSDLRPISLSNFISKVFSRIINERLVKLLPLIISPQQTGFVKGRSIVKNILLVQEIVHEIRIRGKLANTVIKLDMAKAYDRVSWLFLTKVLRKMGFGEFLIDMVYRLISNNWYSILINGQAQGFFKSTKGVKQGDPLSPTLFIIAAECMTRALNELHKKEGYVGYGMPKWSPYINHLAYADDTIIFTSAQPHTLKLVMNTLAEYEKISGQKINKEKSAFYQSVSQTLANSVVECTHIPRKEFLFTYLGIPIYYGRKRIAHFKEITEKIHNRLGLWTRKLLSIGGKTTLINHVLQSMPIHLLSACDPPSGVFAQIHGMFAKFFWSNSVGNSSKHWDIWWQLKQGNSYFWLDNWTGKGSLCHNLPPNHPCDLTVVLVNEVQEEGRWKEEQIRALVPKEMANHILQHVQPPTGKDTVDKAYWKLDSRGIFTVSSAYQVMRQRREVNKVYEYIWIKGLPTKICFFMWRMWKSKLPLDETLKKWGFQFASRCNCYEIPKEETISHVFLNSHVAQTIWKYFCGPAGFNISGMHLSQVINLWWEATVNQHIRRIYQVIPTIIVWEIWKRRNAILHGGKMTVNKLKYQILHTVDLFMKASRKNFRYAPYSWMDFIKALHAYSPKLKVIQVCWKPPDNGWIKCNIDGASRGNPGRSSWSFCVRNSDGDLIYAQAKEMKDGHFSNTHAEVEAILQALRYMNRMNILQMVVETDSMLLKNVIEKRWNCPWHIINILEEIWRIMGERTILINHIFREGNKLADFLANVAFDKGDVIGLAYMVFSLWTIQCVVLASLDAHSVG
ncbi:uncharacterized protein LOC132643852 [Lycium barbarum]|uniref:uncharacterized protein LOC132643852 n=1 Tax=Lycium barbarum TaxID=112863 RepID=UPI00293E8549|nr:uncharacterized protein LOC132643852 [Lycium barbarum]